MKPSPNKRRRNRHRMTVLQQRMRLKLFYLLNHEFTVEQRYTSGKPPTVILTGILVVAVPAARMLSLVTLKASKSIMSPSPLTTNR